MKDRVLLLHGWNASDYPHWQSWLAGEIAKNYGTVSFPKLHDTEFPDKNAWKEQLKQHLIDFKPDIVICHSIANILWFHMCNEEKITDVKKLYLVAPPSINTQIQEIQSFFPVQPPKNLHAKEVLLITSTNDPYLSMEEAKSLQNSLGVEMIVLKDAGHINTDSNYGQWQWILNDLNLS